MRIYYFAHALRSHDPAVQAENIRHAQERLSYLRPSFRARGIHLWAPWIDLAIAGVDEEKAVAHNLDSLIVSDGIVVDRLVGDELSEGVLEEVRIMKAFGKTVEVAR